MAQAPFSLLVRAVITIVIHPMRTLLQVAVGGLSHRLLVFQRGGKRV